LAETIENFAIAPTCWSRAQQLQQMTFQEQELETASGIVLQLLEDARGYLTLKPYNLYLGPHLILFYAAYLSYGNLNDLIGMTIERYQDQRYRGGLIVGIMDRYLNTINEKFKLKAKTAFMFRSATGGNLTVGICKVALGEYIKARLPIQKDWMRLKPILFRFSDTVRQCLFSPRAMTFRQLFPAIKLPACPPIGSPACSPMESPACSPMESPACSPMGSPACSPMGSPACSPMGSPACSPMGSPACSPVGSPVGDDDLRISVFCAPRGASLFEEMEMESFAESEPSLMSGEVLDPDLLLQSVGDMDQGQIFSEGQSDRKKRSSDGNSLVAKGCRYSSRTPTDLTSPFDSLQEASPSMIRSDRVTELQDRLRPISCHSLPVACTSILALEDGVSLLVEGREVQIPRGSRLSFKGDPGPHQGLAGETAARLHLFIGT
jgi:hypothetical protein